MFMARLLLFAASILLLSDAARAAMVGVRLDPVTTTVGVNTAFSIDVIGTYLGPTSLAGGSFSLAFDPGVLSVASVTVDPVVSDIAAATGLIDNVLGTVDTVGFATFFGVSGTFRIATISFFAIGAGVSALSLSDPMDVVFAWTNFDYGAGPFGDTVTPVFSNASISVVPLPAAIWLLVTSLFTLAPLGVWRGHRA